MTVEAFPAASTFVLANADGMYVAAPPHNPVSPSEARSHGWRDIAWTRDRGRALRWTCRRAAELFRDRETYGGFEVRPAG